MTGPGPEAPEAVPECEWFLNCRNLALCVADHPTLGQVPICHDHATWLLEDWSPTKMVPPMVARRVRQG